VDNYDLAGLIFAREVSGPLTSLVKQMDKQVGEAMARHPRRNNPGVFIVFCNDDPNLKTQLQQVVVKEGLKHVVLCAVGSVPPKRYAVANEADLTVLIWKDSDVVKANFPLRKGDLDERKAKAITEELSRVLPK
jgi:hypothetical protein